MYLQLALFAAIVLLYSLTSGRLERTPLNGALVFVACGVILGPLGLGALHLELEAEGLSMLAELALSLVLFTDAAKANLGELKHSFRIPLRLLLVGLPLTILLGYVAGVLLFEELSVFEIALVATMLAPTDAALGKPVVTNPAVPVKIREGLNVESGLNDGICVPILFVFLALADTAAGAAGAKTPALTLVAQSIGVGVAVGIALTLLGVRLAKSCAARGWVTESWRQLPVPALALTCFAVAQWLGGSGFIACFVGGMLFGRLATDQKHELLIAAEGTGDTLALITWVIFGAGVLGQSQGTLSWQVVLYAVLSLTLVRMLPVMLALTGLSLGTAEKVFIGWFGPRGLASIVFAVIVLHRHLPGTATISMTVVCTVTLSVLLHGLSANPAVTVLAARLASSGSKLRR